MEYEFILPVKINTLSLSNGTDVFEDFTKLFADGLIKLLERGDTFVFKFRITYVESI